MKTLTIYSLFILLITCSASQVFADKASHLKAANNLLDSMHLNQTMIATVDKMVEVEIQQNPQLALFKDVLHDFFVKYMTGDVLYEAMTNMYMEEFKEQELNDITAFYKKRTGQKAIERLPILTQKGALWGKGQVTKNIVELTAMIDSEVKRLEKLKGPAAQ